MRRADTPLTKEELIRAFPQLAPFKDPGPRLSLKHLDQRLRVLEDAFAEGETDAPEDEETDTGPFESEEEEESDLKLKKPVCSVKKPTD